MKLKSADFAPGQKIPGEYTCTGHNVSPKIIWDDVPETTKSFVLIVDDPDAPVGNWTHWLAYNIPANTRGLPSGIPPKMKLENGILQGKNDFRKIGYGGPCPPQGHGPHRYFFRLYALDSTLNIKPGAEKEELERAMTGHILDQAELMGKYER